jgi:hypothetical protein
MSLRCELGFHDWSWSYIGSTCQQTRCCSRCGESGSREHHDFGPGVYLGNDKSIQTCSRCGKQQTYFTNSNPYG